MSWREHILTGLDPGVVPLALIGDPDGLFHDEDLAAELKRRGYLTLAYDDPVVFRLAYEADIAGPLVVVVWGRSHTLNELPYDLLARGAQHQVGLAELFPRLHIPVLEGLQPVDLDRLWEVYGQRRGTMLGADETAATVLQLCFGITLDALQTPVDALAALLALHTGRRVLPQALAVKVEYQLARIRELAQWPVHELVHDRLALESLLERAWPRFLIEGAHLSIPPNDVRRLDELRATYHLAPALPFDDPRVWPIVDTLFLAGRLSPLRLEPGWRVADPYAIGTVTPRASQVQHNDRELARYLGERLPAADAAAGDWLSIAPRLGELLMLRNAHAVAPETESVIASLSSAFTAWLPRRYGTLLQAAPLPRPRLVSHIPHWMAMERERGARRQALLVMDGLALDQWAVLRAVWEAQGRKLNWDEQALFAWLPTLTAVSRQAIFAGQQPRHFAGSLERTDREEAHWRRFWGEHGLQAGAVAYVKGLHGLDQARADDELRQVEQTIEEPGVQVIGLVVDTVDRIAHGMRQGEAGMLRQVEQWAETGWLAQLLELLQAAGYRINLTADHGNIAVRGAGRPADGVLAEERGLRARIYRDASLRDRTAGQFPGSIPWSETGLPPGVEALLAAEGQAFAPQGELVVAHGGADLREVLVPWCILR